MHVPEYFLSPFKCTYNDDSECSDMSCNSALQIFNG